MDPADAAVRADAPELADEAHGWKSAYVHIPFCRRRCPYCDFAIVPGEPDPALHERYVSAVLGEIAMAAEFGPLDAINFGGGTPSMLDPRHIATIVAALGDRFGLAGAEISIEVNPEDWSDDLAEGLREAGVDRVSVGAQSLDGVILGALGRLHDADAVSMAVDGARTAGFRSVGIDLILGHPGESEESWARSVERAMSLDVDHVSTYALTVEPGTDLAASVRAGAPAPNDDVQADRYESFMTAAQTRGITRYEVSNHARPGHHCRYNLATWAHGEYLGFGMAAHGHRWGNRTRNHRRLDRYLGAIESGTSPVLGEEHLGRSEQERDRLMLGLRLAAGTPMSSTAERFAASDEGRRFLEAGLVRIEGDRMFVTDPLRADMVARAALSVPVVDC